MIRKPPVPRDALDGSGLASPACQPRQLRVWSRNMQDYPVMRGDYSHEALSDWTLLSMCGSEHDAHVAVSSIAAGGV
jgi:hypothetical protein